MAVAFVVAGAYIGWTRIAITPEDRIWCAIAGAAFAIVFGIPVALGWGYFWGTTMAYFLGYTRPEKSPTRDTGGAQ